MKFVLGTVSTAILGYMAHQIFDWWVIALIAGIIGAVLHLSSWRSFMFGFLGGALLWGIYSYIIDQANAGLLSSQIASLFERKDGFSLIIMTALLGGLLGGLGAATGTLGRDLINADK